MELQPEMFKKILPLPVTVITTISSRGIANAAPYSCVIPILRPLDLIAIASALPRDTLKNIRETGEFVVNVIGPSILRKAIRTARSYPPDVNELEMEHIETISSRRVAPPRIRDAVGWIEARLDREVPGERYVLVIGKVVCTEINDKFLVEDELSELPTVLMFPHFRRIGEVVAKRDEFADALDTIRFEEQQG
ncbi:flavin reductase family protein [Thermodesulforhabdus norvegica]|uniref:NADH-FMN oxidoreductase RutF, flavin reductase (DIM6/NTAB) family n=1 Tax=Thermodesulforhabdus norvegica TaxID=39841 RepID=A0A1I4UVE3_9BACT|nr:flavin reductase family protein [Thermodesulforhabdus norvegica]SFM92878.1 NADH-FMN oxidoreductase RutF, flavin reductase (DIM6/NTAB) family [Thermodesulforhabdus norvegica]